MPVPRAASNAGRPEPPRDMMLFGGIKLRWPIFIHGGLPFFIVGKELGQRSCFTLLLRRR